MRFYPEGQVRAAFEAKYIPEPNSGCWLWTGAHNGNGYPVISIARNGKGGKNAYAYRLSYEWAKGPIPPDKEIDHLCRIRWCVNPDHLEAVTHRVNMLRGNTVAAFHAQKTECKRGHPFTADNVYFTANGKGCVACRRMYDRTRNPIRKRKKK